MSKGEEAARPGGARQETALLLRKGFARHQAGDLAAAMTLYGQALAIDPKQPDALNLAGVAVFGLVRKARLPTIWRRPWPRGRIMPMPTATTPMSCSRAGA